MKKSIFIIIITILILIGLNYLKKEIKLILIDSIDYKNASYVLDGETFKLKNGILEIPIDNSSSTIVIRYFGNEVKGDFNSDGRQDIAFLLSQETGGTGVFFYIVTALNTSNGYLGSEGYFIGDRVAPQSTVLNDNNTITVNYADRGENEAFSVEPSIGKSLKLFFNYKTMRFISI